MTYRDNNFTDYQIKGINMVFNATKKKYSFLKEWVFSPVFEKYNVFLYIDAFVDYYKIADYLDLEVRDYYKNREEYMSSSALSSILKKKDGLEEYGDEGVFNLSYGLKNNVDIYLNNLYALLPIKNQIFYQHDDGIDALVKISIDNYTQLINSKTNE